LICEIQNSALIYGFFWLSQEVTKIDLLLLKKKTKQQVVLALSLRGCHQDKSLVVAWRGVSSSQNPSENLSKNTHANGGKNCSPVKTPAAQRQRGRQAARRQRDGGA
jgi:hypothetical protein